MKFAVWILVLAAALSLLSLLAAEMLPEGAASNPLFRILGLGDPFRSWWFRLLLGVLALSLLVCVIERAPILIRQAFLRSFRDQPGQLAGIPNYAKVTLDGGEAAATALLKRLGLSVARQTTESGVSLAAVGGGLSRLGPLLNHLGMLLLILGGLAISLTTHKTQVIGAAGDVASQPEWGFSLRIDEFRIIYYPVGLNMWVETTGGRRGKVELVKGDSAKVSFGARPGGGMARWLPISDLRTDFMIADEGGITPFQGNIKSYVSSVTVLEGGAELYRREIEVNHPLRERGYRFYQTSFQPRGARTVVDSVVLHCTGEGGEADIRAKVGGDPVPLPWGGYSVAVPQFFGDFRLDEQYQPFSASDELRNPAARVELFTQTLSLGKAWAFSGAAAHMGGGSLPVSFGLTDLVGLKGTQGGYATILEVNREEGRPLIWGGFAMMTLGLLLAYTMTHRQAWAVVVSLADGRDDLHLAAASQRDPLAFRYVWNERIAELAGKHEVG